jgi:tRNA-specific 2-thiouridylase
MLGKPGDIETTEQEIIGRHQGLIFYTLGQRQGLGIGGQKNKSEAAWYVVKKDLLRNVLIVAQKHDHPLLYRQELSCDQIHWIKEGHPDESFYCQAKTRYRQPQQPCQVTTLDHKRYFVKFEKPQWAITPGQSVVFYQDELCLGGGIINDYE